MMTRLIIALACFSFLSVLGKGVISSDSLLKRAEQIYQLDPLKSYGYCSQAIEQAKQEGNEANLAKALEMFGVSLDYLGKLDSAIIYFNQSIEISLRLNNKRLLASVYKSKANSLFLLNKNNDALVYYLKALDLIKSIHSEKEEASLLMGIANVYSNMKSYDLSLKYYFQSLEISEELKDSVFISYNLTNIAEVYANLNNTAKEFEFHRKALAIKENQQDKYGLVYSYSNMAELLADFGKKDSALYYSHKAIATSLEINNKEFLSTSYRSLGRVYFKFGENEKAVENFTKALNIAHELKNIQIECTLLKAISDAQIKLGRYKEAADNLNQFIILNDSVSDIETRKSFNELQTQFETEKKEKEISLLNERDKKRSLIIYSVIAVTLLLGAFTFVLYNRFKLKQRTAAELEQRNTEISLQKNIIEEKQKEITDSIHYAKRIQNTLLTHKDFITQHIPFNFIFFKPKDIVSGDFYWAAQKNNYFYLAVCDSTGHGVPGAFISLLNIGFLSEAINEKNITEPHLVFNYVRDRLINSISREGQRDGFDGVLLCINSVTREISYVASNNSPVLVSGNQYFELEKNKMPVGQDERMESFNLFNIKYEKGDTLYLYTDGYADQFGGTKGKKFKYKALNEKLLSISSLSMNEQLNELSNCFDEWKGELEQVDDVCVLGLKF